MQVLEEVCLSIEEAEAIRLKDVERLEQGQSAERMNISRPTFQRVLSSARQKIADALLNGKAILIEGGNYEMAIRRFRCRDGHEWDVTFEEMVTRVPPTCPECRSENTVPIQLPGYDTGRGGWGGRRGGRGRWRG
jgi:predicted DNA-binding protein (UPF0251 family)